MSAPRELTAQQRDEIIHMAVEKRLPIVATGWDRDRWVVLRSRFLPRDPGGDLLCIEPPVPEGSSSGEPIDFPAGANLGITFRRGHHKCMFATTSLGKQRVTVSAEQRAEALLIRRPTQVQSLQRRAFMRAIVPCDVSIPARVVAGVWNRQGNELMPPPGSHLQGRVLDLSAGGIRVRMGENQSSPPGIGQGFALEFQPTGHEPLRMDTLYRHCQAEPDGAISWGLQIIGLEANEYGQQTLAKLARLVTQVSRGQ